MQENEISENTIDSFQPGMKFEPRRYAIKVRGGALYLPVAARLIWFHEKHADWSIETEPLHIDHAQKFAVFRAKIIDETGRVRATGTAREDVQGFPEWFEKAETKAIGRALALCGFGTQFAPELSEGDRYADSPQQRQQNQRQSPPNQQNRPAPASRPQNDGAQPPDERAALKKACDGLLSKLPEAQRGDEIGAFLSRYGREYNRATVDDLRDYQAFLQQRVEAVKNGKAQPPANMREARELIHGDGNVNSTKTADSDAPQCTQCSKMLTRSQQELSIRHFGEALCPGCQKLRAGAKQQG